MNATKRVVPRTAPESAEPALPSSFGRSIAERLVPDGDLAGLTNVGRHEALFLRSEIEARRGGTPVTWAELDRIWEHHGMRSPARFPRDRNFPRP